MANAFYFGDSSRRLFGIYEAPAKGKRSGVVLCNPWGSEYLYAHQSLRYLSQLLADAGQHVLRFDWYGAGDSAGESTEGGEPASWLDDLGWAIDELADVAGIKRFALVGFRLGAAVAAEAAAARKGIKQLVLWDPVLDGKRYIDELCVEDDARAGTVDALGAPLTDAMRASIGKVTPALLDAKLPPALFLYNQQDEPAQAGARAHIEAAPERWSVQSYEGPRAWHGDGDFGSAGMPVAALRAIAEYLA